MPKYKADLHPKALAAYRWMQKVARHVREARTYEDGYTGKESRSMRRLPVSPTPGSCRGKTGHALGDVGRSSRCWVSTNPRGGCTLSRYRRGVP